MALQLGQCHRGDGGGRGHRRPADGTKGGTGQHGRHGKTSLEARHHSAGKTKQGFRDAALGGEMAHQNKQRNDRQVVAGEAGKGLGVEKVAQRPPARLGDVADAAGRKHGNGNRYTNKHQPQHDGKDHQRQHQRAHGCTSSPKPFSPCHSPMTAVSAKGGIMAA